MTNSTPLTPPGPDAHSLAETFEEDASLAGVAAADTLRAGEVALVVLIGLLVCPPLAILVFVVFAPLLVAALVVGLVAAILSVPYLLVHHFRGHHDHVSLLRHRLRRAGRALIDLAPHRIVADAREADAGQ